MLRVGICTALSAVVVLIPATANVARMLRI